MIGEVCLSERKHYVYTLVIFCFVVKQLNASHFSTNWNAVQCEERYCSTNECVEWETELRWSWWCAPNADLTFWIIFCQCTIHRMLFIATWKEKKNNEMMVKTYRICVLHPCDVYFPKIAHTERKTWIIHVKNKEKKQQHIFITRASN